MIGPRPHTIVSFVCVFVPSDPWRYTLPCLERKRKSYRITRGRRLYTYALGVTGFVHMKLLLITTTFVRHRSVHVTA